MKPALQRFAPPLAPGSDSPRCCPVAGFGIVRAGPDLIAGLRRNPVPPPGQPLPAAALKHADEQTIVGVAAVYQAIHNHNLSQTDFAQWGVVAVPCFLGRADLAQALNRFMVEGAWGISPHIIPHHSVHAVSGTISQILKIHGPNFGIGGGPEGLAEALMIAATLLADPELPGLWVVMTGFEPELIPTDPNLPSTNGHQGHGCQAHALALALVPQANASIGLNLLVCPQGEPAYRELPRDGTFFPPLDTVSSLATAFAHNGLPAGKWRLGANGWLELTSIDIEAENLR